ncbi:putative glutamine amidotransferase [Humibacillus xanthopallidus]|uniref:Putative glutamine amidotransferase n=1 Tax=Humibacillus xanthopallidus TaxID=412689 RepID=A0A543PQC3_9MICO|nr:putative glutamine amidotransferase [Humibacillus xanthopallidus]
MRPLIAVVGRRADSVPILRFSATLAAEAICEAVYAAGGEPVILHGSASGPDAGLTARLARFDGLLVPGGADLGPGRYGQEAHPKTAAVVDFQDDLDIAVTRSYLASGIPTLAICRGLQVLNVVCGGTLEQHLTETTVPHGNAVHLVDVVAGSRLAKIVDADSIDVSSYHHQAIAQLGRGLTVTAVAGDGVVEAVEHESADVIAVQWHPEDRHLTSHSDAALFADLVERAARRKGPIQ